MSRRRDFYAAKLSLARLLGDEGWCYLWTLTSKGEEPLEAKELLRRWKRFRDHRTVKGWKLKCFRVVEKNPKDRPDRDGVLREGHHIHFVTSQRLDAGEVWKISDGVGLGRPDVERIPAKRAAYILKYLRKDRKLGCRAWAVVGLKGVTCKSVVIEDTFSQRVAKAMPTVPGYSSFARYALGLRNVLDGLCKPKGWQPCLGVLLNPYWDGLPKRGTVMFGEYRGRRVDSVTISVKGGPEKETYQVVRDLVVVQGRSGMVRRHLKPGEELPLPPAPVCRIGAWCIIVVRWSSMRGFTFDSFGHVEPLPLVPGTVLDGSVELTEEERVYAELATCNALT